MHALQSCTGPRRSPQFRFSSRLLVQGKVEFAHVWALEDPGTAVATRQVRQASRVVQKGSSWPATCAQTCISVAAEWKEVLGRGFGESDERGVEQWGCLEAWPGPHTHCALGPGQLLSARINPIFFSFFHVIKSLSVLC